MSVTSKPPAIVHSLWLWLLVWKAMGVLTSYLATKHIPYLGFFSYGSTMLKYQLPDWIRSLSNFDGIFYIRIATQGYQATEQAYFPLYPWLIELFLPLFPNPIITGIFISNICFLLGIYLFRQLLPKFTNPKSIPWILALLISYPTAHFFGVMYTESLFFLLLVSSLYFVSRGKVVPAITCAFCVALTKVIGILIVVPLTILLLDTKNHHWKKILPVILAAIIGFSTYITFLTVTTGDPLYFIHAQENFGAHRSSHLISPPQVIYRYIKIFLTAQQNLQYWVAVSELAFYIFAIAIISIDLYRQFMLYRQSHSINPYRLGIGCFSLISALVPSLTGTLTAFPRYSLLLLTIFIVLGEIPHPKRKLGLVVIFYLLQLIYQALFIQGYYLT